MVFLEIQTKLGKTDTASCKATDNERVKSLDIIGLETGKTIYVEKSNDGVNWVAFPGLEEGEDLVIVGQSLPATVAILPGNYLIRLRIEEDTVPEGLTASML
ncbi:MAG: hypothetical protein LBL00_04550 [Endomicrobium sp.]|jgi:hypothetical protein|nr:hypothetical protein [Endomicrobium sp.]